MEANGDKPISPLSVAAEPHCVSVVDCSWGGGQRTLQPPKVFRFPAAKVAFGNRPSRRIREA